MYRYKVVILAGGLGLRLESESSEKIPKPLTTIGNIPIIEHIMNIYGNQGFDEFVLCLGYKGELIKKYFDDYYLKYNMRVNLALNQSQYFNYDEKVKTWKIDLINTGLNTATGSRILKAKDFIVINKIRETTKLEIINEPFFVTYGDGLANIDLQKLLEFHKSHGKLVTVTTVQPKGQFGVVEIEEDGKVINFSEKPKDVGTYISAGFFVVEPKALEYIDDLDNCWWESDVLPKLVREEQVMAYRHTGSFKSLDSPKDKKELEEMWNSGKAFWK